MALSLLNSGGINRNIWSVCGRLSIGRAGVTTQRTLNIVQLHNPLVVWDAGVLTLFLNFLLAGRSLAQRSLHNPRFETRQNLNIGEADTARLETLVVLEPSRLHRALASLASGVAGTDRKTWARRKRELLCAFFLTQVAEVSTDMLDELADVVKGL
jgi:hypothetical protein